MLITPITQLHPLWPQWMKLYHESFPEYERIPTTAITDGLDDLDSGCYALAFTDNASSNTLLGMAYLIIIKDRPVAYLVYLAVDTHMRNKGVGAHIYDALMKYAREAGCSCLFFEVEHPDDPNIDKKMATRRIDWYLRRGAELITGLDLRQRVSDELPRIQYYVMTHRLAEIDDATIISNSTALFHEATMTSEPRLCRVVPPSDEDRCTRLQ